MPDHRFPDFYIVGAPKCGTTTAYHALRGHPDVYLPAVKEPHYFSDFEVPDKARHFVRPIRDEAAYLRLYAKARPGQVRGDASNSYLSNEAAVERIHAVRPDARILVLLRDPVARLFSQHLMAKREGIVEEDVTERIGRLVADPENAGSIRMGMYGRAVERYVERFGKDQIHVVTTEELKQDPHGTWAGIASFLRIDPDKLPDPAQRNTHAVPRNRVAERILGNRELRRVVQLMVPYRIRGRLHDLLFRPAPRPEVPEGLYRLLTPIYGPELERLETALGRDFSCLRKDWPGPT